MKIRPQPLILKSCAGRQSGFQSEALNRKECRCRCSEKEKDDRNQPWTTSTRNHTGSDVARENKVRDLCRVTRAQSKNWRLERIHVRQKNTQKLKLAKNTMTIGTRNVQTLWAAGKLELLRNEMKRFRYDIIGISEVRWTGKGETPNGDFIWSGEGSSHIRGVGILLSIQAKKALIGYNPISSRIISAWFDATPFKISVIHVYTPTSSSSEDVEAFYNDIEEALTKTDKKDILILTGEWNAKIGNDNTDWKSVMGKYGYGDRNERGERLLEFATVHDLYICNTKFQHKPNRKRIWASSDGIHKNMIDLIFIQRRWKTSVTNCRTF